MLQTIREKLTGWFAIFILGAIALTLAVTFGNIDTGFSGGTVAATVNGEDISMDEFRQLYNRQRQQWEATFQDQVPDSIAQTLADSVVQMLINNRLVASYVRDAGYRVNDPEVINAIQSNELFHVGGRFSRPAYEQILETQGYNSQRFEYETRQDMQLRQFQAGIEESAFFTPNQFRRYIQLDGETRAVEYALLKADVWAANVELDPEAIAAYYADNQASFQTQEKVDVEYVEVNYNEIVAAADIGDAEAEAYFNENRSEFAGPDERQVSHILIAIEADEAAALAQAVELRARLDSGENFEDLAREYSADTGSASRGGDLGWFGVGDAPAAEFDAVLNAMQPGEISAPVKTEFGYHLLRLEALRASDYVTYADVRIDLLERLRADESVRRYGEQLDELDDLALESLDGLSTVAESMGLELKSQKGFTRQGGAPLGTDPELIDIVFSLEVLEDGENSRVIELDDGRAVVVHVTKHYLPEQKPLEAVRDDIEARLRSSEAMLLAANAGSEIVEKLQAGENPQELAADYSIEWRTLNSVRRGDQELSADLISAIFKAPKSDNRSTYKGMMLASGDYAIYRVTAVTPGSPESFEQESRDQRKAMLSQQTGGSQLTALVETLSASAKTSVVPNLLGTETDLL